MKSLKSSNIVNFDSPFIAQAENVIRVFKIIKEINSL